jgi:hypothetical protein
MPRRRPSKARPFPLQPGESRGTDLAETLEHLAIRLETEIFGPADLRQEDRRA